MGIAGLCERGFGVLLGEDDVNDNALAKVHLPP